MSRSSSWKNCRESTSAASGTEGKGHGVVSKLVDVGGMLVEGNGGKDATGAEEVVLGNDRLRAVAALGMLRVGGGVPRWGAV